MGVLLMSARMTGLALYSSTSIHYLHHFLELCYSDLGVVVYTVQALDAYVWCACMWWSR